MITKMDKYITEGVRDLMTPKTSDELDKSTKNFSPKKKLEYGINNSIPQLVKKSIEEGVDVNMKDSYDKTPLIWVASKSLMDDVNDVTIVKMLLDNGAEINHQDSFGLTALMFAAHSGDFKMVELLLDNGADASLKDKKDATAMDYAESENHRMVVFLLRTHHLKKTQDELSESVKDLMTPKNPRDAINHILENPRGFRFSAAVNALEIIKQGDLFGYMTDEDYKKIAEMAKDDFEKKQDTTSGMHKNIVWFMNKYGGGQWFINIDNGRAYEINSQGAYDAIRMLKKVL